MKLGQILIRKQIISLQQLEKTVDKQPIEQKKIGELLIAEKLISSQDLELALKEQYWRRNGFWVI